MESDSGHDLEGAHLVCAARFRRPSMDWPLSREEKKCCAMQLYERDVQTANEMLNSQDKALRAAKREIKQLRRASLSSATKATCRSPAETPVIHEEADVTGTLPLQTKVDSPRMPMISADAAPAHAHPQSVEYVDARPSEQHAIPCQPTALQSSQSLHVVSNISSWWDATCKAAQKEPDGDLRPHNLRAALVKFDRERKAGVPEQCTKLACQLTRASSMVDEQQAEDKFPSAGPFASELFKEALSLMEKSDYSAKDIDKAQEAFACFRRAVMRLAKASGSHTFVDQLEPKVKILEFLVDLLSRHPKYRSRISSLFICLLDFDNWKAAVHADSSVRSAVREITDDLSQPKRLTMAGAGMVVNLGAAAHMAFQHGSAGALYVRVIAAYNLARGPSGKLPDPYVRITCGGRMKRTHTVGLQSEPHWQSLPFMFQVPAPDSIIKFEILESGLYREKLLGSVSLTASCSPRVPGLQRHTLAHAQQGELEIMLVFMAGQSTDGVSVVDHALTSAIDQLEALPDQQSTTHARRKGVSPSRRKCVQSWKRGAPPSSSSSAVMTDSWLLTGDGKSASSLLLDSDCKDGQKPMRCHAGHLVDERKDGLRWHEGRIGLKHVPYCSLCGNAFGRNDVRWRCSSHCHFNVCEYCHTVHAQPPQA